MMRHLLLVALSVSGCAGGVGQDEPDCASTDPNESVACAAASAASSAGPDVTPVRPQAFIPEPLRGGRSSTPDGRLIITGGSGSTPAFAALVFRPEYFNQTSSTTPAAPSFGFPALFSGTFYDALQGYSTVKSFISALNSDGRGAEGAFSVSVNLTLPGPPTAETGFSTRAAVLDPAHAENPATNPDGSATYYLIIYSTSVALSEPDCVEPSSSVLGLGAMMAQVTISSPKTLQAHIDATNPNSAIVTKPWSRLQLATPLSGNPDVCGRHPSATVDGRLIVIEDGAHISYLWNNTPRTSENQDTWFLRGWSHPQDITKMYYNERSTTIDGVPFARRYPIAAAPLKDDLGRYYRDISGAPLWIDGTAMPTAITASPFRPTNPDRHLYNGGYPWITPDGTDILSTSVGAWQGGASANPDFTNPNQDADGAIRAAEVSIGQHSGYAQRHMDAALNSNRASHELLNTYRQNLISSYLQAAGAGSVGDLPKTVGTYTYTVTELQRLIAGVANLYVRLILSSPGAVPSMWGPYREVKRFQLPYQRGRFIIPIFGTNGQYDEFNYDDTTDGDYLLFMHMQESVERTVGQAAKVPAGTSPVPPREYVPTEDLAAALADAPSYRDNRVQTSYQPTVTPDSSGHPETFGTLSGGAAFPQEYKTARDEIVGVSGQAIYFPENAAVTLSHDPQLNDLTQHNTLSVGLFVKRLANLAPLDPSGNPYRFLVNKSGVFNVIMERTGNISTTVFVNTPGSTAPKAVRMIGVSSNALLSASACTTPCAAEAQPWVHVAFTYNGNTGLMAVYLDGRLVASQTLATGTIGKGSAPMVIGPGCSISGQKGACAGAPLLPASQAYVLIDEVSVSGVERPASDIARSAYLRQPVVPISTGVGTLPLGLDPADIGATPAYPVTPALVQLGDALFSDTSLSSTKTVACATCHQEPLGFTDGKRVAVGIHVGTRNTPTTVNRALGSLQFFDGRAAAIEDQVTQPFLNPKEMGNSGLTAVMAEVFMESAKYTPLFAAAGLSLSDQSALSKALGAYVRATLGGNSRVDQFEAGDLSALTKQEQNGRLLFRGKARCITCHSNSNYTDERFHRTGVAGDAGLSSVDLGRFLITGLSRDYGAFKTPSLRNISKTGPYMHDGSIADLGTVISRYNAGSVNVLRVDDQIQPLGLSLNEMTDLQAFLRALDNLPPPVASPLGARTP
jgi:cytochrome c peroxidase